MVSTEWSAYVYPRYSRITAYRLTPALTIGTLWIFFRKLLEFFYFFRLRFHRLMSNWHCFLQFLSCGIVSVLLDANRLLAVWYFGTRDVMNFS